MINITGPLPYGRGSPAAASGHVQVVIALCLASASLWAQATLDPAKLLQPPTDTWPTYNGDYSGRRYSTLAKINASNINSLALSWVYRANPGPDQSGGGRNTPVIKATPLEINGVLYFTIPD